MWTGGHRATAVPSRSAPDDAPRGTATRGSRSALGMLAAMTPRLPTFEFHISRVARDRYGFADGLFSLTGNVVIADLRASRDLARRINVARDTERHPERAVSAGGLNAMGLIDEVLHLVLALYRAQRDPRAMLDALTWLEARLGRAALDETLGRFADEFPVVDVHRGRQ